eukprot:2016242-Pyramimonas_sp.AAC.2
MGGAPISLSDKHNAAKRCDICARAQHVSYACVRRHCGSKSPLPSVDTALAPGGTGLTLVPNHARELVHMSALAQSQIAAGAEGPG